MGALEELLRSLPLAIGIADADGRVVSFNAAFTKAFGYTVKDIPTLADWWLTAYPDPDYRAEVVAGWEQAVAAATKNTGPIHAEEYRVTCASGEERVVQISGAMVQGKVYALFEDLTDTRLAERSYREQLDFSNAVIASAADGICVCHDVAEFPFVRFTVWSERMEELTGYTLEQINELGWYQSLYPNDEVRERAIARMDRMRVGDNLNAERWTIRRKDGRDLPIAISTSIVLDRHEQVHVLGIMHDMTEELAAEAERRAFEEKLWETQRLESLGVLAGGVAHDFNNLLVAILGHADLASGQLPPDSKAEASLKAIATAATRAAELTNQLLAYSGKGRFVVQPTELNELIEEMSHLLAAAVPKTVELSLALDPSVGPVNADAAQMRQVVMNLITNASEAITAPAGKVTVRTRMDRIGAGEQLRGPGGLVIGEGQYAVLSVADDGEGMDEATQARIFEPFFTSKFTGRGLGLAAALGIVRGHGGSLLVHSIPGEGSRFDLWLPLSDTPSAKRPPTRPAPVLDGRGRRALVVDDEPSVRLTTQLLLEQQGFEVVVAADGYEALDVIEREDQPFDVVLLDLTMPRMGGDETLHKLREVAPQLPVVVLSGFSSDSLPERLASLPSVVFLQKPFRYHALAEAIAAVTAGAA